MKRRTFLSSIVAGTAATAVGLGSTRDTSAAFEVGDLRCEYATNPLGIDVARPRLSWVLTSHQRGESQSAYQVLVGSDEDKLKTGEGDLWDSGKVLASQSTQVAYAGKELSSRQRCFWKVRAWDTEGEVTRYSDLAHWEMGLLSATDWKAHWIGFTPGWNGRAIYLRYDFDVHSAVSVGRAYVSGLGYYELHLNGERVGDRVLDPAWTEYGKRVMYSTYDVGALLKSGKNTIGVIVGNGWYGMPKLLLQVEATYPDGTRDQFYTHGGFGLSIFWRVTSGPVVSNSIYEGETYDARLEKAGWDLPGPSLPKPTNRIEGWTGAHEVAPPSGRLVSEMINPIKIVDTLQAKKIEEPKPGVFVYDFGQESAGWAELRVNGTRGTRVTLRFSENLFADGTVNQENLILAAATDAYVLKGGEEETWEPAFTYHGYRYVQVEGFPGRPQPQNLRVKVVRSSVDPIGTFETSNELINRIHKMVWWTEGSNLYGVPTDCPQRSERMGWLNDLTVRAEESIYNFDVSRFFTKFLDDIGDTQIKDGAIADTAPFKYGNRPADPVDASYLILGWLLYQHYGDTRAIARHFAGFKAWTDYLAGRTKDGIVTYGYYGDWSQPKAYCRKDSPVSRTTPRQLMSTGFLYYCSRLVSRMAQVLGREDERLKYAALAQKTSQAFNREYFNDEVGAYGNNDESANSFALYLGLAPENQIPRVVGNLVGNVKAADGHVTTGNLCTKYLLEALTGHGRADLAYEIATQQTYPSWGYMLANGATTLWERWENLTGPDMDSHNHPMMGSVDAWFYKYIAGIKADPKAPGFKKIVLHPHPVGDLTWARGEYVTMYGKVRCAWHKDDKEFRLNVTVPGNTRATVYVPARDLSHVKEGGRAAANTPGVKWLRNEKGAVVFEVGCGDYEFTAE